MSTSSQGNKFGSDAGQLHQIALSLRAVCKNEEAARDVAAQLAHNRSLLQDVVGMATGKPPSERFSFEGFSA